MRLSGQRFGVRIPDNQYADTRTDCPAAVLLVIVMHALQRKYQADSHIRVIGMATNAHSCRCSPKLALRNALTATFTYLRRNWV